VGRNGLGACSSLEKERLLLEGMSKALPEVRRALLHAKERSKEERPPDRFLSSYLGTEKKKRKKRRRAIVAHGG